MPASLGSNHFICLGLFSQVSLYSSCSAQPLNASQICPDPLLFPMHFTAPLDSLTYTITSVTPSTALTSTSLSPDQFFCVRNPDITVKCLSLPQLENQIESSAFQFSSSSFAPPFHPCHSSSPGFHLDSCNCLLTSFLASALISSSSSG